MVDTDTKVDTPSDSSRTMAVKKNFAGPFHYVPTEQNPADLATRGIPFSAIPNTWFEGPQWLSMPEAEWPQIQCASFPDEEETQTDVEEINLAVVQTEPISTVIDPTRVQHWRMLKNVTKHVLRFLNIKLRGTHPFPKVSQTGLYSASDDRAAELLLIRHAQLRNPPELKEQQRWSMAATSEGVLRCFTRMELNEERPMLANPIFLPPNDPATELIVMHGHRKLKHQPVSHLVLHLRQQFFIPRSRQTVKRIVDSCCKVCHVWDAKPAAIPPMEPLPKQRMRRSRAFEHIGLDYMGPRMVKTGRVAKKVGAVAVLKGGQDEKIWIMLATCMATRAVYLDCIRDLSAKTFLNALRRLIADLGTPSLVVSDNAPQFALADATLKEVWRQTITDPEVTAYFATNGITWRYITAYNPREGGFYERLNAMVKRCLKRAVGRRILDNDEMQTFIREVAAILNARPLVAADDDLNSYVAVRPIDFVVPYAEIGLPSEDDNSEDWLPPSASNAEKMAQRFRRSLNMLDKFWEEFFPLYLAELRETLNPNHRNPRSTSTSALRTGQLVLLEEDGVARGQWKLARITELHHTRAGAVKTVSLKLKTGNVVKRAVDWIYPLEVGDLQELPEPNTATEICCMAIEPCDEPSPYPQFEPDDVGWYCSICYNWHPSVHYNCNHEGTLHWVDNTVEIEQNSPPETPNAALQPTPIPPIPAHAHSDDQFELTDEWPEVEQNTDCPSNNTKLTCRKRRWSTGMLLTAFLILLPSASAQIECDGNRIRLEAPTSWPSVQWQLCCYKECWEGDGPGQHLVKLTNVPMRYACRVRFWTPDDKKLTYTAETQCGTKTIPMPAAPPIQTDPSDIPSSNGKWHENLVNDIGTYLVLAVGTTTLIGVCVCITWCRHLQLNVSWICRPCHRLLCCFYAPIRAICSKCRRQPRHHNNQEYETHNPPERFPHYIPSPFRSSSAPAVLGLVILMVCAKESESAPSLLSSNRQSPIPHNQEYSEERMMKRMVPVGGGNLERQQARVKRFGNPVAKLNPDAQEDDRTKRLRRAQRFGLPEVEQELKGTYQRKRRKESPEEAPIPQKAASEPAPAKCPAGDECPHAETLKGVAETLKAVAAAILATVPTASTSKPTIVLLTIIAICCALPATTDATPLARSIVAKEETCTYNNGVLSCTVNYATALTLLPNQHASFVVRGPNAEIFGTISINLNEVRMDCLSETLTYTREFNASYQTKRRCPKVGSCSGSYCEEVQPETLIPELADANQHPGISSCLQGCEWGIGQCDCGLPTRSCIFLRKFALFSSPTVFEVFECSDWVPTIHLTINSSLDNLQEENLIALTPGVTTKLGHLQLTPLMISDSQLPIIQQRFFTNGANMAMLKNLHLSMTCASEEHAHQGQCEISEDICKCHRTAGNTKAECNCTDQLWSQWLRHPSIQLPHPSHSYILNNSGRSVYAVLQRSPIQLHLVIEEMQLGLLYTKASCELKPVRLNGCVNCPEKAHLEYECSASDGKHLAQVQCDEVASFFAQCDQSGLTKTVAIGLNEANVNVSCQIECPAGKSQFNLSGQLRRVLARPIAIHTWRQAVDKQDVNHDDGISSFANGVVRKAKELVERAKKFVQWFSDIESMVIFLVVAITFYALYKVTSLIKQYTPAAATEKLIEKIA
jgi:hypothetical protein